IVNGVVDHVHFLVRLPADLSVSKFVDALKSGTTQWLHTNFPSMEGFSWQTGYSAFTDSRSRTRAVWGYIANQEAHHRTMSFHDELGELLRRHGLKYDVQTALE